jgi:hypothetical protein
MAKKLVWGKFSIEELVVNKDDDIFKEFPFLKLEKMEMIKVNELCVGDNTVRGTKDTVSQKIVGLSGSLLYGWDRTSWPIPFMGIGNKKEAFDRRHTLKVCRENTMIKSVPSARYSRVFPSNGEILNNFTDNSILTIAAMWGNVYGPVVDDTKDYMFETACVSIIRDEIDNVEQDLLTRSFVRTLLKHMGCYDRYNENKTVIERIVTKVLSSLQDPQEVVGKLTINNNESDVNNFVENSDDWGPHNTENDKYKFLIVPIQDNSSYCQTYAERLLTSVCKNESENPQVTVEGPLLPKTTKILLWNKENSLNAKKIVASRQKFKEHLNNSWRVRRDNVLKPIEEVLNPKIITRKKLFDLNMEIWCMNQLDGEDELFEMCFDDEV